MKSYEGTETLLEVLSFVAVAAIIAGLAAGIAIGMAAENVWLGIMTGAAAVLGGLGLVAVIQIGHAVVDIAKNTAASAEWANEQLRREREHQRQPDPAATQSDKGGLAELARGYRMRPPLDGGQP